MLMNLHSSIKLSDLQVTQDIKILYVAPLTKLKQNTFYFGKYKELDVSILERIDMKYVDTFKNLYTYLTYFSILKDRYHILIIDQLEHYVYEKDVHGRLKKVRQRQICKLNLILYLLASMKQFLLAPKTKHSIYYVLDLKISGSQVITQDEALMTLLNIAESFSHDIRHISQQFYVGSLRLKLQEGKIVVINEKEEDPQLQKLLEEIIVSKC